MRLFWEIARRSFQRQVTFRAAAIAGIITNLFFGMLRVALMMALFANQESVAGLNLAGAITFTGLTQAAISFLSLFNWTDLMNAIHDGSISNDLLKPVGFYRIWLAQDFGRAMAQFALRGLPIIVVYVLFFDITYPTQAGQWLAFIAALLLGWLISFSWRFLVNLSAFWVPNAVGIGRFFFALSYFLSGFVIPLRFMPDWFVTLCKATPFPHALNTMLEVYLGVLQGGELLGAILAQILWAAGLIVAGQIVLNLGIRRLTIAGG
jgi:ABC-2 type transport system permease protein